MRVLSLVADPGIPLNGRKGASIHVLAFREALLRAGHDAQVLAVGAGSKARVDAGSFMTIEVGGAQGEDRFKSAQDWIFRNEDHIADWSRADVVLERLSLFPGAVGSLCRRLGAARVLEVNAPLAEETAKHRTLKDFDQALKLEQTAIREADGVITVSRELTRRAAALRGEGATVLHLPNGVDLDRPRPTPAATAALRKQLGIPKQRCVVNFLGSLKPWHGVAQLVESVERAVHAGSDLHLLVVGDGPEREHLESMVKTGGLTDRTTFTGAVPSEQVPEYLACCDVGSAPYPELPGFYFSPLKVGEYAAAGLPVVMSALDDLTDLLPVGRGSITVPPGDVQATASALERLARDPAERTSLGRRSLEHARKHLDWTHRVGQFEGLVKKLLVARKF